MLWMLMLSAWVESSSCRKLFSMLSSPSLPLLTSVCWVPCIEATMGISRALRTHGFGATYLDGYGERLEGNDEGSGIVV